jgi:hypothetical protein
VVEPSVVELIAPPTLLVEVLSALEDVPPAPAPAVVVVPVVVVELELPSVDAPLVDELVTLSTPPVVFVSSLALRSLAPQAAKQAQGSTRTKTAFLTSI